MSDKLFCGLTEETVEEYSPLIAASEVIIALRILVEITQGHGEGAFFRRFGNHFLKNRPKLSDPDKFEAQKPIFANQSPELWAREQNSFYICAATVFAFDTIDEYRNGSIQHAWVLATEAKAFMGMAGGSDSAIVMPRVVKSTQAKLNNFKSKEKNRNIKADVLKYYEDNINTFSNMTDAAGKMETIQREKGEKVAFNTILDKWLPEFHKENPSIPKPKKATPLNNK